MMIPRIGMGTYRLGDYTFNSVMNGIKLGYRHIDTAKLYKNQSAVAQAIYQSGVNRSEIFLTTKIPVKDIENGNIVQCVMEMMSIFPDYIDTILLHAPASTDKLNRESWQTLIDLQKKYQYKIKNIGVSNFDVSHLEDLVGMEVKPSVNQIELSPFLTRDVLVHYCEENKIPIVAHSSLIKGEKFGHELLTKMGKKYEKTEAQILLKWAIQKEFHIIPRTKNPKHLEENNELNFHISGEDMDELSGLNDKEQYATHWKYV
jgi:diketogulonate reductase-like aldo/keto reductase